MVKWQNNNGIVMVKTKLAHAMINDLTVYNLDFGPDMHIWRAVKQLGTDAFGRQYVGIFHDIK